MLKFNPYDPAFNADPYPVYARMRAETPVYYNPDMNHWVLSRYDDVIAAHLDEETFTHKYGVLIEDMPGEPHEGPTALLHTPEPEHGLAKRLAGRLFGRPRMNALDIFIRKRAAELLEQAAAEAGGEEFDFVSKVTVTLPLDVISELLGIPEEYRATVHHLCNGILIRGTAEDATNAMNAMKQATGLFMKLSMERRANPRDDIISMLIADEVEDEEGVKRSMSDVEIAIRFVEMALAGHETVAKAIPNGCMAFQKFPEQRRLLMEDRSLLTQAADEILRYDPPSQIQGRKTTRDVTIRGVTIPEGARVLLATASASRDPDAFPDADQFDITRPVGLKSHYFGYGGHKCLGIHLARQEIAIVFDELFTRFPDWEVFPDRVTRLILSNVRGVATLPMRLGKHA
jgi:cytochrome P450